MEEPSVIPVIRKEGPSVIMGFTKNFYTCIIPILQETQTCLHITVRKWKVSVCLMKVSQFLGDTKWTTCGG